MRVLLLVAFFLSLIVAGCGTTSKDTFYWGNYSTTLYDYKKNPDEKTLEAHKKELVSVMEISEKKNKIVPPGVNAEYGYLLLKEGQENEGFAYLAKEIELYPESTVFITRIKDEYAKVKK
jgi:hypothetical protein